MHTLNPLSYVGLKLLFFEGNILSNDITLLSKTLSIISCVVSKAYYGVNEQQSAKLFKIEKNHRRFGN